MGTASEWMRVLAASALFGTLMILWDALTKRELFASWFNLVATALVSVLLGMMMAFGWRVLHGGIAIAVLGAFAIAFAGRRARQAKASSKAH